jgi:hypothetical protein
MGQAGLPGDLADRVVLGALVAPAALRVVPAEPLRWPARGQPQVA